MKFLEALLIYLLVVVITLILLVGLTSINFEIKVLISLAIGLLVFVVLMVNNSGKKTYYRDEYWYWYLILGFNIIMIVGVAFWIFYQQGSSYRNDRPLIDRIFRCSGSDCNLVETKIQDPDGSTTTIIHE